MKDGDAFELFITSLVVVFFSFIFWNIGYDIGMKKEQTKVIQSQDYVDRLRNVDSAKKELFELKKVLNNE